MTKKRNISYREKNWGKKRERNPALFAAKTKKKKKIEKKKSRASFNVIMKGYTVGPTKESRSLSIKLL